MHKINSDSIGNNNSALLEKQTSKLKQKSPKYKVLLHNDPVNSMAVSYTHLTLPTMQVV